MNRRKLLTWCTGSLALLCCACTAAGLLPSQTPGVRATSTLLPPSTISLPPAPIPPTASIPGAGCIPTSTDRQAGKVVKVIDGDTIDVEIGGQVYKIRYIGMDTPEDTSTVEAFGAEAKAKNQALVDSQIVTLVKDVSETDRYGRLLRYVIVGDLFVNYELVRQGYAMTASFPPDVACIETFRAAEREAREASTGLWAASTNTANPPVSTLPPTRATSAGGGGSSGGAVCNCSGPDLDCSDFQTHPTAQACFDYCVSQGFGDIFHLDIDQNGLACERLP